MAGRVSCFLTIVLSFLIFVFIIYSGRFTGQGVFVAEGLVLEVRSFDFRFSLFSILFWLVIFPLFDDGFYGLVDPCRFFREALRLFLHRLFDFLNDEAAPVHWRL